jgi:hypothetical protein
MPDVFTCVKTGARCAKAVDAVAGPETATPIVSCQNTSATATTRSIV